jgi:subfamily B ATP-binding cassette protein HlyB/CyaB
MTTDKKTTPGQETSFASKLELFKLYCTLQGLHLDAGQLKHQFATAEGKFETADLNQALVAVGFESQLKKGSLDALSKAASPLLVVTQDQSDAQSFTQSFAIVGGVDANSVVIQRPGQASPQRMTVAEFKKLWTGQWLQTQRNTSSVNNEAGNNTPETSKFGVGWFWYSLKKYKGLMGEILLASFFVQIFALITPLIFQVVIDKVLTHRSLNTLDVMVIALLGVSLFEVILGAMRHYLFSHTTNRIDVELGAKLFKHLMHLPLSYFESRRAGDTVARVRELENARNFMTGQALTSWLDLFFAVVYLAVMFYYSPMLTFIVLAALPVFFGASWIITPILRKNLEDKFAMGAENQAFLVETVTSMETLKGQAVEPHWQREWERRLADYVNVSFNSGHIANATNQFISFASKLMTVFLLWFGAKSVIDGDLTVGGLIAFNMLSGRVNAPILKLASLWQDFTQMKVSIKRLGDIMDAPAEPAFQAERATPPAIKGRITFDHVNFRYSPKSPEIVSDMSFDVQPGEIIGVVGVSGAGKTTLMRLIQRLYTPERGRILIDGMDLNLVDTSWLRRQIGVVGQDTVLFNRSVRENIAFSDLSLSMDKVMEAAKLAGAHEFISELPEGYDTVIGERGSKLSGGQRSRIAIARALVTDPRLLLLDEATASLDYESERVIHDNMAHITKNRTVFIVAHRLPTLRLANRILVIERGRLIEVGNHVSLMQQGGRYADLYRAHQVLDLALNTTTDTSLIKPAVKEASYV